MASQGAKGQSGPSFTAISRLHGRTARPYSTPVYSISRSQKPSTNSLNQGRKRLKAYPIETGGNHEAGGLDAKTITGKLSAATCPSAEEVFCCLLVLAGGFASPFLVEASRLFPVPTSSVSTLSFTMLSTWGEKATPHEGESLLHQHTGKKHGWPPNSSDLKFEPE